MLQFRSSHFAPHKTHTHTQRRIPSLPFAFPSTTINQCSLTNYLDVSLPRLYVDPDHTVRDSPAFRFCFSPNANPHHLVGVIDSRSLYYLGTSVSPFPPLMIRLWIEIVEERFVFLLSSCLLWAISLLFK